MEQEKICGHDFKDFICDGKLIYCIAVEPWSPECYICEKCDGTYCTWQKE